MIVSGYLSFNCERIFSSLVRSTLLAWGYRAMCAPISMNSLLFSKRILAIRVLSLFKRRSMGWT